MTLKTLLSAAALVAVSATTALADKVPLNQLSRYLNEMRTAKGAFTQINSDGTISTGTIFIKRPGRIRFEYNPPDKSIVLASGGSVVIYDPKANAVPESYPLKRTPLSIILARNVNLGQARMVTAHTYDGTSTTVRAQDPENPDIGNIQLVFTGNPVELRQWVITDDAGTQTTVILGDLQTGVRIGDSNFNPQLVLPNQN